MGSNITEVAIYYLSIEMKLQTIKQVYSYIYYKFNSEFKETINTTKANLLNYLTSLRSLVYRDKRRDNKRDNSTCT